MRRVRVIGAPTPGWADCRAAFAAQGVGPGIRAATTAVASAVAVGTRGFAWMVIEVGNRPIRRVMPTQRARRAPRDLVASPPCCGLAESAADVSARTDRGCSRRVPQMMDEPCTGDLAGSFEPEHHHARKSKASAGRGRDLVSSRPSSRSLGQDDTPPPASTRHVGPARECATCPTAGAELVGRGSRAA